MASYRVGITMPWECRAINALLRFNVWLCLSARLIPMAVAQKVAHELGEAWLRRFKARQSLRVRLLGPLGISPDIPEAP